MTRLYTELAGYTTTSSGDIRLSGAATREDSVNQGFFTEILSQYSVTKVMCIDRPLFPPGVDLMSNIEEARQMGGRLSVNEFVEAVRSGGKWDFKSKHGPAYEKFGNWHFGLVAAAFGWSEEIGQGE